MTGAWSGIGAVVARALPSRGARVALVARTAATLDALAGALGPMTRRFDEVPDGTRAYDDNP